MKFFVGLIAFFISTQTFAFTLIHTSQFKGWQAAELTIDYNQSSLCTNIELAQYVEKVVKLWNSVSTSRLKLKKGSPVAVTTADVLASSVTNITFVCNTSFTSDATIGSPDGSIIGLAIVPDPGNGQPLNYGSVILNADTGSGALASLTPSSLAVGLAHELGHVLGLGHSEKNYSLMYYGVYSSELALSADDRQGITFLYPRDEGTGGAFGCGTITKITNSYLLSQPKPTRWVFLLLMLPLFVVGLLRVLLLKSKYS